MKWAAFLLLTNMTAAFGHEFIAHRGASGTAPENTIAAIIKAQEDKFNYIEIDVHLTKDNHVVVLHDATVDRTTDGSGKIRDLTLAEVKQLDAGSWFSPEFKGERIPTLEEVLKALQPQSKLIIEFKYGLDKYSGIEEQVVALVKKHGLEDRTILKSFNTKILNKIEETDPSIPRLYVLIGAIGKLTVDNSVRARGMFDIQNVEYYQVHRLFLRASQVRRAHALGKKIIAWGVRPKDLPRMERLGVDIVEMDELAPSAE